MENRHEPHYPIEAERWDNQLIREPLPRKPRSPELQGRAILLSTIAALLVIMLAGASVIVGRDLRTPGARATNPQPAADATTPKATPTPVVPSDPKENGWTQVTTAGGAIAFSASSPQRGYLCGTDDQKGHIIIGVTTNGGKTWKFKQSSAAYQLCAIAVSPTNARDVAVSSEEGSCAAPCPHIDVHYSTDGGSTWAVAPFPQDIIGPGGAIWSGAHLYLWAGANLDSGQRGFLEVSANGGPFTPLSLNRLLPGAQSVSIASLVVSGATLYLNLAYTGCPAQTCQAIVASTDGGKTWRQIPNQSSIQLVYGVGTALYGETSKGATTTIVLSHDNGSSWTTLTLPALPGGQTLDLSQEGSWLPGPDGTIFTAPFGPGVAYLRGGVWTLVPFSSSASLDAIGAISFDANGRPERIWGLSSPQASSHGIYWHTYP